MAKSAWGLDVSSNSVKAVKLTRSGSGVQLTAIDVVDVARGGEGEDFDSEAALREALETIVTRNRMKDGPIVSCFPSHAAFNRFIKLPPVEPKKVAEIVRYEAQQHIPFPLDEVIWDYQVIDKAYEPGEEMEVVLFAIKREIVTSFLDTLAGAHVTVDALQFAPVALYNYVMYDQDPGGSCVVLDIGGSNTDLVIVDAERFWIRNLPIAGNDITKALQKKFQVPFEEAERMKVAAPKSGQATKIYGVIQPVMRDLVGEVHRSIGYYKSLSKTAKFDKILIVGSGSKTLNFQKFLSQNLQMTVNRLSKLGVIDTGSKVDEELLETNLSSLGVACGLALQGLELSANRINLLPPELLKKKEASQKKPWIAAAVGVLGLLVGWMSVEASGRVEKAEQFQKHVEKVQKAQAALQEEYRQATAYVPQYEQALSEVAAVAPERDLSLKVLNAISALDAFKNNGDPGVPDDQKLWVLSLSAAAEDQVVREEVAIIPEGADRNNPDVIAGAEKKNVIHRIPHLKVTAIVGAVCRKDEDGRVNLSQSSDWVKEKLATPIAKAFAGTASTSPNPDEPVERLEAMEGGSKSPPGFGGFPGIGGGGGAEKVEARYYKFRVEWDLLVGEKARQDKLAGEQKASATAAPEAGTASEGGGPDKKAAGAGAAEAKKE